MRFLSSFCYSWPPLGLPLALRRPPTWPRNVSQIVSKSHLNAHSLQEHPEPSPRSPKSLPKHPPNLDFGYEFNSILMVCWHCFGLLSCSVSTAFQRPSHNIPAAFVSIYLAFPRYLQLSPSSLKAGPIKGGGGISPAGRSQ